MWLTRAPRLRASVAGTAGQIGEWLIDANSPPPRGALQGPFPMFMISKIRVSFHYSKAFFSKAYIKNQYHANFKWR
jgi:hypothetical protein